MPPRAKFMKEEIVDAALSIVRADGIQALTARALGEKLGSSARPIFTVFQNMEEVQDAVIKAAKALYKEYVERGLTDAIAFRGVGTQYILFAIQEPKLFQLLFMAEQEQIPDLAGVLMLIEESYDKILASVGTSYGLYGADAERIYRHMWIYSHGIATLCATKMCHFSSGEIQEMLAEVCTSLVGRIKGKKGEE
ncbi:MAG: WHG domain-containing protein [Blautia sp.]|nr:WHG domain-containing protein [Blautia sp.]